MTDLSRFAYDEHDIAALEIDNSQAEGEPFDFSVLGGEDQNANEEVNR